jgi:putative heme-binding domain-containing protein
LEALLVRAPGVAHEMIRATPMASNVGPTTITDLARLAAVSDPTIRRELASAAVRLSEKHDVTPLLRALMARQEDAKDPIIPQLVWIAYEKIISKKEGASTPAEKELAWLAEQAPDNIFVRDQIVPKVMRRLVATGQPADLKMCIDFVTRVKDANTRQKALDGLSISLAGSTVNAPDGWATLQAALLKENDPKLVPLVNKLAVNFRDPAAVKRALTLARSDAGDTEQRVAAIRDLATLRATEAVPVLLELMRNDRVEVVRSEAVRSLATFDQPAIPTTLLAGWKDLPKAVQPDVVNTLATRKEWAKSLLQAMSDKKIDRAAVTDNTIIRIQAFNDRELNSLIEKAWGRTRPTPKELNDTIDKTRASLYEAPASFARGKIVFENNCGKCHKFDGKGAEVGPPLEGAARDIEYLLANVLDPNRVIGAPYFLRVARLADGTVQQGVLAEEDDKSITLKLENGVLKKIPKADLEGPVQTLEKSLMPEGLGYNMTPQDFRDMVRYTMANPFITDVTINGTKQSVGVPGRIAVPESKGEPVVVEASFTVLSGLKTTLLLGSSADYEVRLNGTSLGTGKGGGKQAAPDQASFAVTLPAGTHTLAIVAKNGGGVAYARFLDPDRKLRYPDAGEKK